MAALILTLDIGGTHVSAAGIEGQTGLLRAEPLRLEVDQAWPADRIFACWAQAGLAAAQRLGTRRLERVAVSMPGPFDYRVGTAQFHQKMTSLNGLNVTAELQRRWAGSPLGRLPISYLNDAVAFALGEFHFGKGRDAERLLGVTLGTGFGGGFIDAGLPVTHRPDVPAGGTIWQLPYREGQAEDYFGAAGLRRAYSALGGDEAEPKVIAARAGAGEPLARRVFEGYGLDIGTVLRPWVECFRPDVVVFGGQISRAWPLFSEALRDQLGSCHLARSDLLDRANLLGAAQAASHTRPPHSPQEGQTVPLTGGTL